MTTNNWIEEFDKSFSYEYDGDCGCYLVKDNNDYGSPISDIQIKNFISNLLTKKDQEHKAELEMIKGEIDKVFPINTESNMVEVDMYSYDLAKKDAISILDSHINKIST